MAKNSTVSRQFKRRKNRSKKTSKFHSTLPRLVVYRSLNHFIAQVINDFDGNTIVATSSHDKELRANVKKIKNKKDLSRLIGESMAKKAKKKKISKVVFDSREAVADSMFIAISGNKLDGNQYINDAILNGSSVIVTEDIKVEIEPDITYVYVKNSRKTLSTIASNFYGNPSKKINLVGVTGTNGKTTIVNLLYQFFVLCYHCL